MAVSKYFQGFRQQQIMDRMYISVLVAYNCSPDDFYKNLCPDMETLGHNVYTHSIQAPFLSKIGWLFHSHEHTNLCHLMEFLEKLVHRLNPDGPPIAFGLQFKNICDGYKTPKATPSLQQASLAPPPGSNLSAKQFEPFTLRWLKSKKVQ